MHSPACRPQYIVLLLAVVLLPAQVEARLWSSKDGHFQMEGELISYSKQTAVIRRPAGELVAVELDQLDKKDQEYVKSKEAKEVVKKSAEGMQTWTSKSGMKVRGKILAYGRKEMVLARKFGRVHITGKRFSQIDSLHQRVILRIVSHLENETLEDEKQLETWIESNLDGQPKTYTLEGVMMQLESGDEIGVPFFLFSSSDMEMLEPGWKRWVDAAENKEAQQRESLMMQAAAQEYQRDRAERRQVETLKLDLLSAATGVTSIWQVGMRPRPGTYGAPMRVMVSAQNSRAASAMALQRYPGYVVAGVRRASR